MSVGALAPFVGVVGVLGVTSGVVSGGGGSCGWNAGRDHRWLIGGRGTLLGPEGTSTHRVVGGPWCEVVGWLSPRDRGLWLGW